MNDPKEKNVDPATQEKIQEFCYELAIALRRITGREEKDLPPPDLAVDIGEKEPDEPKEKTE